METTIQEASTNGATANVVPTTIATPAPAPAPAPAPVKLPTYEATKAVAMKVSNKDWKRVSATLEMGAETGQDYHIDGIKVPSGTLVLPKRVTLDGTILQVQIVTVTGLKPHLLYCVPAAIIPVRNSTRHSTQGNVNRVMSATESAMIDAARKLGPGSFPTAAKNIGKPALTQKDATKEEFHAMYPGMTQRNFAEWLVVLHKHRTAMMSELETALSTPGTDIAATLRAYTSPSNIERLYASMASGAGFFEEGYVRPSDEAIKAAHAVPVTATATATATENTATENTAPENTATENTATETATETEAERINREIEESETEAARIDAEIADNVAARNLIESENGDIVEAVGMIARKNGRKNGK